MAALDPAPATTAAADTDPEPGDHRVRFGQLGLGLLRPPLELDAVAAVRATRRQRRVDDPVRLRWRRPMAVAAVRFTLLASRPGRFVARFALGERRRLTLPAPPGLSSNACNSIIRASRPATISTSSATLTSSAAIRCCVSTMHV